MGSDNIDYYHFTPSVAAAAAFAILFGITSIWHTYQFIRSRAWFMIPLLIGCYAETVGYAARVVSAHQHPNYDLAPYLVQSILILCAPPLFAASIYMILGYIIRVLDADRYALIRERWLTKIFVLGDIVSFLTQGTGGSMLAKKDANAQKLGKYIVVGGLVIQLVFFGLFMFVSYLFHSRVNRHPTKRSLSKDFPWRLHMYILYIASLLIMVRSVFRIVEYLGGYNGYIFDHEAFSYGFDAATMFTAVLVFNLKHPSEIKNILSGHHAIGILRAKEVVSLNSLDADSHGIRPDVNMVQLGV